MWNHYIRALNSWYDCVEPLHSGIEQLICVEPLHSGIEQLICVEPLHSGIEKGKQVFLIDIVIV